LGDQGPARGRGHLSGTAAAVGAALPYEFLMRNRDLTAVRGDPRFPGILARSKVQFDEARGILEQARARGELPAYLHKPLDDLVRLLNENEGRR